MNLDPTSSAPITGLVGVDFDFLVSRLSVRPKVERPWGSGPPARMKELLGGIVNRIVQTRRVVLAAGMTAGILQTVGSLAFVTGADAANVTMQATTSVNVRKGPGTKHARLGLLRKGERIVAVGSEGSWTKVEYKGSAAFVFTQYLTPVGGNGDGGGAPVTGAAGEAFTTVNLNLRTAPNLSSQVRTIARKGTKVALTGSRSGDFTQVAWHGEHLWAATRYLSTQAASSGSELPTPTRRMRATTALMIRTTPDR